MEFCKKLTELRKQKGLTQEELAEILYVSRTAISKWESGRGYPGIESLKALARFFNITIDELLTGNELLVIAEKDTAKKEKFFCDQIFGLLDICIAMLIFLPFFKEKINASFVGTSLLSLSEISPYLKFTYWIVIICIMLSGILILLLQNIEKQIWIKTKYMLSLIVNSVGILIFIISTQPYAASFLFIIFAIKIIMIRKVSQT